MKKMIITVVALALVAVVSSCSKNHDNDHPGSQTAPNYDARAQALGFDSAADYREFVAGQCAQGNHDNCDVYSDGSHEACGYASHSGEKHDGSHHSGTDHGQHDGNGHSHNGKHH